MDRPARHGEASILRLMGPVRLRGRQGDELTPRARKARAMLAYLVLTGRPTSRERLADLLWSDRGAEQARSSARQAIYDLRHTGSGTSRLIGPARDEVAANPDAVTTDLSAIAAAAANDDVNRLSALLAECEPGLMTDLDGLDPEFDTWLRVERANEPARTLSTALAAAQRSLEKGAIQDARAVVGAVQRIDPTSEEAARLAMRIDHRLGDRSALHSHYALLRDRLASDYDATPSVETRELFKQLSGEAGDRVIAADGRPLTGADEVGERPVAARRMPSARRLRWLVLAGVAMLAAAIAWWNVRPGPVATAPVEAPLLVVLPFERGDGTSGALAQGLWDDTRLALSENRTARVIGRTTSQALAQEKASPQALRQRLGVDYVLEGSVRSSGNRVRIVVSLTRTTDGVGVWEKAFEGSPGDPMALQVAVAQAIEGRIRGRLAAGGGRVASQIRTTPEVYALYSEARALIADRDSDTMALATEKLRRAVALDPNFAPAWASLASVGRLGGSMPGGIDQRLREAAGHARRAIELAPNLAEGYAALALIQGAHLQSSENYLKRSLALDPSNGEAWNWLGNGYAERRMQAQAIAAYEKAIAIDPYFISPLVNLLALHFDSNRGAEAQALLKRVADSRRDPSFDRFARAEMLLHRGDYSAAIQLLRGRSTTGRWRNHEQALLFTLLMRIGSIEQAVELTNQRLLIARLIRGEQLPPDSIDGRAIGPRDFWLTAFYPEIAARAILLQDRPDLLVGHYRKGFRDRADFLATAGAAGTLDRAGPLLAVALRKTGAGAEASAILTAIEADLRDQVGRSPGSGTTRWELARVQALQGKRAEALEALGTIAATGWRPDGLQRPIDIATDPALEPLIGEPRFAAIRNTILAHVERERRELGPIKL